jgi:hypothetical protein
MYLRYSKYPRYLKRISKTCPASQKRTIANSQKISKPSWPSTWPRYPCRPRQPSCDPRRPHLQPLCRRCLQPCASPHSCFYVSIFMKQVTICYSRLVCRDALVLELLGLVLLLLLQGVELGVGSARAVLLCLLVLFGVV